MLRAATFATALLLVAVPASAASKKETKAASAPAPAAPAPAAPADEPSLTTLDATAPDAAELPALVDLDAPPAPAPAPAAPAAAPAPAAPPAAAAAPGLRAELGVSAGLGRGTETLAQVPSLSGGATLIFDLAFANGLVLGADAGQHVYDRQYLTTLPDESGTGALLATVHERLFASRLLFGFDTLHPVLQGDRASLAAFVELRAAHFANNVAPQTFAGAGGGLRGHLKLSKKLRLEAGAAYSHNLMSYVDEPGHAALSALLAGGPAKGSLRWDLGLARRMGSRTRAHLTYSGEWLNQMKASRYTDGLALGVSFDL